MNPATVTPEASVEPDQTTTPGSAAPEGSRPERIDVRHVTHVFGKDKRSTPALAGVDLVVEPGEFVCLVGSSGCGKTTLLKLIGGFFSPTEGAVEINGTPVVGPGPDRGMVFQAPTLFPWLTVRGNVEVGPRMKHSPKEARRRLSDRYLEMVGLSDVAEQDRIVGIWDAEGRRDHIGDGVSDEYGDQGCDPRADEV